MPFEDGSEAVGQYDRRSPSALDWLTCVCELGGRLAGIEVHFHVPKSSALRGADFMESVETMGLEPTTPCLQSRCSSQLSYVPEVDEF
jgi:hypothetical protein